MITHTKNTYNSYEYLVEAELKELLESVIKLIHIFHKTRC